MSIEETDPSSVATLATAHRGHQSGAELRGGATVGRFVLRRRLGAGTMGVVWAARDPELDRDVAIKVLHPARGSGDADENADEQLAEAQALARLSHPNVVTVYDVGRTGPSVWIAMELIEGRTLRAWLADENPPPTEILSVLLQAGEGLVAAHAAGLVHRDFKPDNVMVAGDGRVLVLDFGLARVVQPHAELSEDASTGDASAFPAGTPAYMAPEHARCESVTPAADQFSFAVTVWEALVGQRPFSGETLYALLVSSSRGDIHEAPPGSMSPSVEQALRRSLQPDPQARWPTMAALLGALRRTGARRWWAAAAALAMGAVVAGGVFGTRTRTDSPGGCADPDAELAQAWTPQRHRESRAAVLATHAAYAEHTWSRGGPRLESYAQRWRQLYAQACRDREVQANARLFDARMLCLRRARAELDAVLGELADVGADTIEHVPRLVGSLMPLERCAEAVPRGVEPPPPELAAEVRAIEDRIVAGSKAREAGRYAESEAILRDALEKARSVGYAPLEAEAGLFLGEVLTDAGAVEDAAAVLQQVHAHAKARHVLAVEIMTAASLAFVLSEGLGQHDEALEVARAALQRANDTEDSVEKEAKLRNALGVIYAGSGDFEEAERELRAALALAERGTKSDHLTAWSSRNNLASVLHEQERHEEAEAEHRALIAARSQELGPDHPHTLLSRLNLAGVVMSQRDFSRAEATLEDIRHDLRRNHADDHPLVVQASVNLAALFNVQGRYAEAAGQVSEVLLAWQGREGARAVNPTHVIVARLHYGHALGKLGRYVEAEAQLRDTLALLERHLPAGHGLRLRAALTLSRVLREQGRLEEAQAALAEWPPDPAASGGSADPELQRARAEIALSRGDLDEARALLSQIEPELDPVARAEHLFLRARIAWAAQQRETARELARHAASALARYEDRLAQRDEIEEWLTTHGG